MTQTDGKPPLLRTMPAAQALHQRTCLKGFLAVPSPGGWYPLLLLSAWYMCQHHAHDHCNEYAKMLCGRWKFTQFAAASCNGWISSHEPQTMWQLLVGAYISCQLINL